MKKIFEKINFRQPKYMLPAILYIPLLGASYFIFDLFHTETADIPDKTLQTTEFLNPELPEAQIKDDGIGSKYENMEKSWGKIQDYSAVGNIERDEPDENKEEYESQYTQDDIALLDEQQQEKAAAAEIAAAKEREQEALAELEKALAEARLKGQNMVIPQEEADTTDTVPPQNVPEAGTIDEEKRPVQAPSADEPPSAVVRKVKTTSDYFNTLAKDAREPKLIQAIIDEDIKAVDGSRIRLRLLDDVEIDECVVKRGTYLYATVSGFSSGRVKGNINSILVDDELVKVSLALYDTDGMEGLYVPNSQFRETSKDVASSAMSGNMSMNYRKQPRPMGNAGGEQRLPEDEQRHQQGHQEKQGQAEIRDFRLSGQWSGKKEIKRFETMETDISKLHEGTDGFYYDDFLAPDKAETFVGQLVSTQWWQKGGRFALICNFLAEDGRKIALFAFQKYTGFYGPGDGAVNFKHAEMNTFWECEVRENRKGRCTWASALQLGGPKNNAI